MFYPKNFQKIILSFYKTRGRHHLPWRNLPASKRNPYHILVSEIMLQQTQVNRVISKYQKFLKTFPTFESLANTPARKLLKTWQGLGYNRRALNLQRAAQQILKNHKGKIPSDPEILKTLPGLGPYTAGAISAFAFNKPAIFLDTNIRRIYIHHFFPHKKKVNDSQILKLVKKTIYRKNPRLWYSALMDYGALNDFGKNPNIKSKHYTKQSNFKTSPRFIRAKILTFLLHSKTPKTKGEISKYLSQFQSQNPNANPKKINELLLTLQKENIIKQQKNRWSV